MAHLAVYAVLAVLLQRAIGTTRIRRRAWWAMVGLVLYAITDEIHQTFVPGRTALLTDVAIDAVGGLAGLATWRYGQRIWKRWRRRGTDTRPVVRDQRLVDDDLSGWPTAGAGRRTGRP
jgi:VanZ family protein